METEKKQERKWSKQEILALALGSVTTATAIALSYGAGKNIALVKFGAGLTKMFHEDPSLEEHMKKILEEVNKK